MSFIVLFLLLPPSFSCFSPVFSKVNEAWVNCEGHLSDNFSSEIYFQRSDLDANNGSNIEQDYIGGSWFNGFDDEKRWDSFENVTVDNGKVRLADNRITPNGNSVGLWHFDGGVGSKVLDSSGNNNHGALLGGYRNDGRFGKAIQLDGNNNHIEVPTSVSLNVSRNITLEAWIKREESYTAESILSKGPYAVKVAADGRVFMEINNGSETMVNRGSIGHGFAKSLVSYDGKLYGGTTSGRVYIYNGGTNWSSVGRLGASVSVFSLAVHEGELYGATHPNGRLFRYNGKEDWIDVGRLGDAVSVISLTVYNGKLYGGTDQYAKVFRYDGGATWSEVGQLEADKDGEAYSMTVYNGKLYCGHRPSARVHHFDGNSWTNTGKLGTPGANSNVETLAVYKGKLYGGTYPEGAVYRYNGGAGWTNVGKLGDNTASVTMAVYNGNLYGGGGHSSGMPATVYRYEGGSNWESLPSSSSFIKATSFVTYDGKLFISTRENDFVYSMGDGLAVYSPTPIPRDDFVHIGATYNGTMANLFINGEKVNSSHKEINLGITRSNLLIGSSHGSSKGGRSGSGDEHFKGIIDEVSIFDKARSVDEIRLHNYRYRHNATINSENITLPNGMNWSVLSVCKTESLNTNITIDIIDTNEAKVIEGYNDLAFSNVNISNITSSSIRLDFHLSGNGSAVPFLVSSGIEWTAANGWRDSFSGSSGSRLNPETPAVIDNGHARLKFNRASPDNTSGLWAFDDGFGDIARDLSGNMNNGTLSGAKWAVGRMGGGLEFDGIDDHVNIELNASESSYTMEMWFRTNDPNCGLFSTVRGNLGIGGHDRDIYLKNGDLRARILADETVTTQGVNYSDGNWHHLVHVFGGEEGGQKLFIDGIEKAGGRKSASDFHRQTGIIIGYSRDADLKYFNGTIDEVTIYDRALSSDSIIARSRLFQSNATLRSRDIQIPNGNTWRFLKFNRTLHRNTYLNISFHDAITGQKLLTTGENTSQYQIDLSGLNARIHSLIYLQGELGSNISLSPELHSWGVNWTPTRYPELQSQIDDIEILEDVTGVAILDLREHFYDIYDSIEEPKFDIDFSSDPNVTLKIENHSLKVDSLPENWTGKTDIKINCTNLYGLTSSSNMFNITVLNVDDLPVWKSALPTVVLFEGNSRTTEWSLVDFVKDGDSDELNYVVTPTNNNSLKAKVEDNGTVTITALEDYFGDTHIVVYAYQIHNRSQLTRSMILPVSVTPVNDPPEVELQSPALGALIGELNATLRWKVIDVDDEPANLTYDLYFGEVSDPPIYKSDIKGTSLTIRGLSDGATYYWYVIPRDRESQGNLMNGEWNFKIDENVPIPEVSLLRPVDRTVLNTTRANLTWSAHNWNGENLVYKVYAGLSYDSMEEIASTGKTWYLMGNPKDNSTYYWTVIPVAGTRQGRCVQGFWSFNISSAFVTFYNFSSSSSLDQLDMKRGEVVLFNFTLDNNGNVPVSVTLFASGHISGFVVMTGNVILPPGAKLEIPVRVGPITVLSTGKYDLLIEIKHQEGIEKYPIIVNLTSEDLLPDDDENDDDDDNGAVDSKSMLTIFGWLGIIIIFLILIFLVCGILFLFRKRAKSQFDEPINTVHTGKIGTIEEKKIDEKTYNPYPSKISKPIIAPSIKHDYTRRTQLTIPETIHNTSRPPWTKKAYPASLPEKEKSKITNEPPPDPPPGPGPSPPPVSRGPQLIGVDTTFKISDIFLIYVDGRLINSVYFDDKGGVDQDTVGGLLSAITDFIKDSFKEDSGALKALEYGKKTIYLERGVAMYVATVFHGTPPPELREKMRGLLIRVWGKYKINLKVWDGSKNGMEGITSMMSSMMHQEEPMEEISEIPPEMPLDEKSLLVPDDVSKNIQLLNDPSQPPPQISKTTTAVICGICMGVVKTDLKVVTCGCQKKYHLSCAKRMNKCPNCGISLSFSDEIHSNEASESLSNIFSDSVQPSLHIQIDDEIEIKMLEEHIEKESEEFRIDV